MALDQEQITNLLTAIGDPSRLPILFLLNQQGRLNVGEIASKFSLSRPTISHHLKILRDADVIKRAKIGQEVYYWLDRDAVVAQLRELADLLAHCADEP